MAFDGQSQRRISRTVLDTESRRKNARSRRGRWGSKRSPLVMFELLEALTQFSGDVVQAARKTWDPRANSGAGGYTVDCSDIILVGDFNETGHAAGKNGFGVAEMHGREDGTLVGVIIDLCCPDDEQGSCP